MKKIIIAIDGYSGCGKSSTAKAVAKCLNYLYIDSGAMYRAVTLFFLNSNVKAGNRKAIIKAIEQIDITFRYNEKDDRNEIMLNGKIVEGEIRNMEVSDNVSWVSAIPEVRKKMVEAQQKMGMEKGIVMDGRDIGTVVFPEADLKIFMTADLEIRAKRRQQELLEKGVHTTTGQIIENLNKRDKIDSTRAESPLIKSHDAIEIDTSHLDFDQQVKKVLNLAREIIEEEEKTTYEGNN